MRREQDHSGADAGKRDRLAGGAGAEQRQRGART